MAGLSTKRARKRRGHKTTLNEEFRRWLEEYVRRERQAERAIQLIEELRKRTRLKGPYTRDQMNER